jgi:DNA polymerase I-like protein with 3'-5' exonuclease and polymerase domains
MPGHVQRDPFMLVTPAKLDEIVRESLRTSRDPHTMTAAYMFGVCYANVSREQRQVAKTGSYAIRYGVVRTRVATMRASFEKLYGDKVP